MDGVDGDDGWKRRHAEWGRDGQKKSSAASLSLFDRVSSPSAADSSTHGYVVGEAWPPKGGGADQYRVTSGPGDPPLDLDALVGNGGGGEEGGEETIVYL